MPASKLESLFAFFIGPNVQLNTIHVYSIDTSLKRSNKTNYEKSWRYNEDQLKKYCQLNFFQYKSYI